MHWYTGCPGIFQVRKDLMKQEIREMCNTKELYQSSKIYFFILPAGPSTELFKKSLSIHHGTLVIQMECMSPNQFYQVKGK